MATAGSSCRSSTRRRRSEPSRKTRRRTRWAYAASCSPSTTSTTSSPACAATVPSSSARSRSTRTSTGSASCVALRASSSDWPSSSAEASGERVGRRAALKCPAVSLDPCRMEPLTRRPRVRAHAAAALAALAVAAVVVALAQPTLGDYTHVAPTNTDNAASVIDAVLRGDLARVPAVQPVMGPVSVALRLPFAGAGRALGGRQLEYWLGAVACLWALAVLAVFLAARVRRREGGLAGPAVVVLVLVANPLTLA